MRKFTLLALGCLAAVALQAQTHMPIGVTGFNHDIIAESGSNATQTTDTVLDATSHIMYTQAFAAAQGMSAGLPDNGSISDPGNTYQFQLADYSAPNAFTLMRARTLTLNLATPAAYAKLSLLAFSTEGASTITVTANYSSGPSVVLVSNYTLSDWFFATTNVITSGFGRITRLSAPPYTTDGLPDNPRFYHVDLTPSCADQQRILTSLTITNTTSTGSNAPFPNAVMLALSGVSASQTISTSSTNSGCNASTGTATVTVSGNTGPYTYSWNSTPVQNTATATGLGPGLYTVTVTNAFGCTGQATAIVNPGSGITLTATATPAAICLGASTQLNATVTGGVLTSITWNPGNLPGASVTVSPSANTTYTVTGMQNGCLYTATVAVSVATGTLAAPQVSAPPICAGTPATLSVQNPNPAYNYTWYDAATGGTALATGPVFTTPNNLSAPTTFYVQAGQLCALSPRVAVAVPVNQVPAPTASGVSICAGQNAVLSVQNPNLLYVYTWHDAASGGNMLATGITFTTAPLATTTTYYLQGSSGACSSLRTPVTVTVNPPVPAPTAAGASICSGGAATLSVQNPQPGITYGWYADAAAATLLASGNSFTSPPLGGNTTYYLGATSGPCFPSGLSSVTVSVAAAPAAPIAPPGSTCSGNSAALFVQGANPAFSYRWYSVATGGTVLSSNTSYTTPALTAATTYYVEAVTGGGCASARTAVPVTVFPAPTLPAASDVVICRNTSATLTVLNPQPGATYEWYNAPIAGTLLFTGAVVTTPSLSSITVYYLEARMGSCIVGRRPVQVTFLTQLPTPVVTGSSSGSSASFSWNAIAGAIGYEVSSNGGANWTAPSSGPTGTTHTIALLQPGLPLTLQVRALASNSCAHSAPGSATLAASIDDVFVPNVFTPNGDGRNDLLLVYGSTLTAIEFRVWDQWGNEVFTSTDSKIGWNGTYRGQRAPVGVYMYVLKATLTDGSSVSKKGSVNLLR